MALRPCVSNFFVHQHAFRTLPSRGFRSCLKSSKTPLINVNSNIALRNMASQPKQLGLPMGRIIAAGAVIGSALSYMKYKIDENKMNNYRIHVTGQEATAKQYEVLEEIPEFKVARSVRNPNDNTKIKFTLYQYQTCPFCCKARAFLDYFGLSYDVIEVNSVTRKQVCLSYRITVYLRK